MSVPEETMHIKTYKKNQFPELNESSTAVSLLLYQSYFPLKLSTMQILTWLLQSR